MNYHFKLFAAFTVFLVITNFTMAQTEKLSNPEISEPVAMSVSRPLSELPLAAEEIQVKWKDGIVPLMQPIKSNIEDVERDGSLTEYQGPMNITAITRNFDGVAANGSLPPDPSGDVGPNHYFQMVNTKAQIWDKNGNSLLGPVNLSTFWASLGSPYSTSNDGDPIVLYDEMADRWLVTQFCLPNYPNGPFYQLIALSTTSNPTGTYYQYAYTFAKMPDYPKFGVWPDGYYMSANAFSAGSLSWSGIYVAVFDRNTMLIGGAATMQSFNPLTNPWSLLPSDCDGTPPPPGTPNYFLGTYHISGGSFSGNTDLDIYEFHVDWKTPANTTFTSFASRLLLTTPSFSQPAAIPQSGTSKTLDNLADRPMNRLQYRNFGSHQSMVVCQTVNAGSSRAGMRWWELRKTSGNWSIYQEGTYAPNDGLYRWMGSVAMDANGNIALGYSVSSSTILPRIRYTGRLATDPLNTMTVTETEIVASGGYQSTYSRWGDYTQMAVDPVLNGTFWYTNQYQPSNGNFNWKTRIAAFNFTPFRYVSTTVSGGNGNGKIDFNECNNLFITLENTSGVTASAITATLSTTTPGVVIKLASSPYPNLAATSSGVNTNAFQISTYPSFVCGTNVSFTLNITYSGGSTTVDFSVPTGNPATVQQFDNSSSFPIPDNNSNGIDVPIVVSGVTSGISKVTVSLYLTHTYNSDLSLQLIAPDNTMITLATNVGGSGDNFGSSCSPQSLRTTFDDGASTSILYGTAPFVGTFKPIGSLSKFIGKIGSEVNGTWKLRIIDTNPLDIGIVNCVSLFISPASCMDGGGECPAITPISIKVIPEGFYDSSCNCLNMIDTVKAYLRNTSSPFAVVDSAEAVIDSLTFLGNFSFNNTPTGNYYLAVNHRNSIETWSKTGGETIIKGNLFSYDFSSAQNKAYGDNLVQKGIKWCIFSGDVNQDGYVDAADLALIDSDAFNFGNGYLSSDITGNSFTDLDDLTICDNNVFKGVGKVTPVLKRNQKLENTSMSARE